MRHGVSHGTFLVLQMRRQISHIRRLGEDYGHTYGHPDRDPKVSNPLQTQVSQHAVWGHAHDKLLDLLQLC